MRSARIDNSGNLAAEPGDGLTIDGSVTVNGTAYTGTLLTGSIADFGTTPDTSGDTPPTETYHFSFEPTGGSIEGMFSGAEIGALVSSEASTFTDWGTSFTGGDKGNVGPLPTITTTPSTTSVTLGRPVTLTDTAALSGGYHETGTITFTLYDGSTLVDTETVAVSGNGSYTTPTGYTLPTTGTVTGTYQWDASYSGDTNNNAASDNNAPTSR